MATVFFIQVLAAFGTQTFTIGFADRANGHFEQGILAQQFTEVDMGILGQNQRGLCFGAFVEGV